MILKSRDFGLLLAWAGLLAVAGFVVVVTILA